ncbi:MAG: DNA/RNA nuclease SfsA [Candidatus Methanoplasma sp.]|jgi:sugar fermentation stimulation protein A|nr:DNA/RNA nuclease SfsA [Candidatus Methanoplasma sp.]
MDDIIFAEPLKEGVIKKRKSQFTMIVSMNGEDIGCHCPTTGRIGDIDVSGRPCLLSKSTDPGRKTPYTVEAVSLDRPETEGKRWIGINQNAVNRYVEHYLRNGGLSDIIGNEKNIQREKVLGASKLDFLAGDVYIEVKMPLVSLQMEIPDHVRTKKTAPLGSTDRFVRHITDLKNSLQSHQKAVLLSCFMYDNPGFRVREKSTHYKEVSSAVRDSTDAGVELWQANFEITPEAVRLTKYFKITFDEIQSELQ